MTPIQLTPFDLAASALLIVADAALSLVLRLGIVRALAVATTRMVLQLLLIGLVLRYVFAAASPWITLAVVAVMVAVAGREVAARPTRKLRRSGNILAGATAVSFATALTGILALTTALRPQPWFDPRYVVPLVGIILGSVLNAASLALDTLLASVARERAAIEARLCLGDGITTALAPLLRAAIRRGLLPIINAMSASGVVTLPGIMTGQILAGLDPIQAVHYQILLMFLLSGGAGLAAVMVVFIAARLLTDERQRLRLDRLRPS